MSYRSVVIVITLLLCAFTGFCQESKLDSLDSALEAETDVPAKVEITVQILEELGSSDPKARIKYLEELKQISEQSGYQKGLGHYHLNHGIWAFDKSNLDSASIHLLKARDFFESDIDNLKLIETYRHLGLLFQELANFDEARAYYERSGVLARQLNDSRHIGNSLNDLGGLHTTMAWSYTSSVKDFSQDSVNVLLGIGEGYYLQATEHYEKAEYGRGVAFVYGNLAWTYHDNLDFEKALEYAKNALGYFENIGLEKYLVISYNQLSAIYLQINQDSALHYGHKSLELANKLDNKIDMKGAHGRLSDIYEELKNYKKALEHNREFHKNYVYVLNDQNNAKINDLQTKYESEKKEGENQLLRQQAEISEASLQNQKTITLLTSLVLAAIFVFAGILYIANRKIKKQKQQAEKDKEIIADQAQKLKALDQYKSRFFANVNHDLRTPLTLIKGYLTKIEEDTESYLSTQVQEGIGKLGKNADRLIQLTEEVESLVILEDGKLQLNWSKVEIVPYLRLLTNMFSSAAEIRKIELGFSAEIDEDTVIHLDRSQFERIVYNLISNALKHTPEGGSITTQLTNSSADSVDLKIIDTGKGIDQEDLSNIFERYFQATNNSYQSREGLGIGLALVKEITQLHGGTVHAESIVGEGSTFTVSLPLNLDKEVQSSEDATSTIAELVRSNEELRLPDERLPLEDVSRIDRLEHSVLIVDDHREVRHYISEIIRGKYKIKQARNGEEALKILEKEKVDLVITDLMMPWLDGFELIEQLKSRDDLKATPVMVVSARTTEEDKMKVLDQGVNDFMSKPFDPVELIKRIDNLVENNYQSSNPWQELISDSEKMDHLERGILDKINHLIVNRIDDSSLTVRDLANEICASERKTYRLIKDLTDHTPLDYIKLIRFDYAKDLLIKNKVKTATEAAMAIGMSNVTQFNKQYKRHFGVSPMQA